MHKYIARKEYVGHCMHYFTTTSREIQTVPLSKYVKSDSLKSTPPHQSLYEPKKGSPQQ